MKSSGATRGLQTQRMCWGFDMKQKKISMKKYVKIMDKIIGMGKPMEDTLIEMLEEAGKYRVMKRNSRKGK